MHQVPPGVRWSIEERAGKSRIGEGKGRGVRSLTEISIVGSKYVEKGEIKNGRTGACQRPRQAGKSDTVEVDAVEKQRGDVMRFICRGAVARAKAAVSALRGVFRTPCRLGG